MDKRSFIKTGLVGAGALLTSSAIVGSTNKNSLFSSFSNKEFVQYQLPYDFNALEPYIDAKTMELHYTKHHATYTQKFNDAVKKADIDSAKKAWQIIKEVSKYDDTIRNNGGGFINHNLYWKVLSPNGGGSPKGELLNAIIKDFDSFESFKDKFSLAAKTLFGSGWVWLIISNDKLKITTTPNQDNPLMDIAEEKGNPIFCIDVWEHAYYLKYKNLRADYINAFWNIVNWEFVSSKYNKINSSTIS